MADSVRILNWAILSSANSKKHIQRFSYWSRQPDAAQLLSANCEGKTVEQGVSLAVLDSVSLRGAFEKQG